MTFAQRRNRLTTHFSERIPVVKRRISVLYIRVLCIFILYIVYTGTLYIYGLYSLSFVQVMKSKKKEEHVARMGESRGVYRVLVGKSGGKETTWKTQA